MSNIYQKIQIRKAQTEEDIDGLKIIADYHNDLLGWVPRSAYEQKLEDNEIFVAEKKDKIVGFVDYHHRRDYTTTLHKIAVAEDHFGQGIGRRLVEALINECRNNNFLAITTKCLEESISNKFFQSVGFILIMTEPGKKRAINLYKIQLEESNKLDLFDI